MAASAQCRLTLPCQTARHSAARPAMKPTATQQQSLALGCVRPSPRSVQGEGRELRRLGDLNPGRARTLTALAVPFRA